MSKYIKTFSPESDEYKKLDVAAKLLTVKSPRRYNYRVGETYFDFGQNWVWTTVLCDGGDWGGYQALNPRNQEAVIEADNLEAVVDAILGDKYCPDKVCA